MFNDSEFEGDTFKDEDGENLSFDKFYSVENNQVKVNGTKIVKFLSNLNLDVYKRQSQKRGQHYL